ncbi:hypothetical protein TRAPUB_2832 [Trametes pubescens]|uniref:Uncharacterized protein n=1 Tax=Trametes pubescens TaxID=154538 RepID=A0A1M2VFF0_TRAPU|nr:hypothetical protein TRAPUB_2832 [Trametes pubescens]
MQRPPHPSDKNHLCNCAKHCGGELKPVTAEDYRKHAPHRVGPGTFLSSIPARAAPPPSTAPPSGPGAAAPRIPPSQPAKRPRLAAAPLPGRLPALPAPSSPRIAVQSPPHGREATASPPLRPPSLSASPPLPPDNAPDPDADEELPEEGDVPPVARLRELQIAEEFITAIRNATLNESHLSAETIDRLRAPSHKPRTVNRLERAALRMFLARGDASEENYADNREAIVELDHANKDIPTYEQLKTLVADLTGIHALREDMCPNTCIAYTGPFADLVKCPMCSEPRYDVVQTARTRKNVARRTFHTFPLGPQVQAMYSSPENAEHMGYRAAITRELLGQDPDDFQILEDVYHGTDYLDAVKKKDIGEDDTVVMLSLDGAQLYESKRSDCWFYIWVLYDLSPDRRYKKRYVLPGGVIGGPNKPKNVDSFLFPGLHHVSALQREPNGLRIWNAFRKCEICSRIYVLLATADGPGMTYLNGLVGHQGCHGCRLYCGMPSRYKPSASTYYPAMLLPENYDIPGSSHPDYVPSPDPKPPEDDRSRERYNEGLRRILAAPTQAAYQRARLETGIGKPSIFSGLSRSLGAPKMFPGDLMHLLSLNIPDLMLGLLRATLPCDPRDSKARWPWAVYADKEVWKAHGKFVGDITRYLPSSFERPPRNPAEKISSGYKAWEWLTYTYGILPALLRLILASPYYRNFCKLVVAVRIILQRKLRVSQLTVAHRLFLEHAHDFEMLYVQRLPERLHFVRPSIHATTHEVPEAYRVGPGVNSTQWAMENYIGNITREIKQHSTPYANVSERALRRCQIIALQAMFPDLSKEITGLPQGAVDLGNGFVLLRARDRSAWTVTSPLERGAVYKFLASVDNPVPDTWIPEVFRWARLELPQGQIARTAWKECNWEAHGRQPRRGRMLTGDRFAEIQYFFRYTINNIDRALAMVAPFLGPDEDILAESEGALLACTYCGAVARHVIPVQEIMSVVAMVPLPLTPQEAAHDDAQDLRENRYFVIEKLGLDVAYMGGTRERQEFDPDDDADF